MHGGFADKSIVLVAYTLSKKLRVYRITINWHSPPRPVDQQPPAAPSNPSLIVRRVVSENLACPIENSNIDTSKAFLTHLEVLPPTLSGPSAQQYFPTTILAVYSVLNAATPMSVIVRWKFWTNPGSLHPAFDQLGVRRSSTSASVPGFVDVRISLFSSSCLEIANGCALRRL